MGTETGTGAGTGPEQSEAGRGETISRAPNRENTSRVTHSNASFYSANMWNPEGCPAIMDVQQLQAKLPDFKPEVVDQIRSWMKENPHLPNCPDLMLAAFCHSCYYNIEATKSCIETYYTLATVTPEFFLKRDLNQPELKHALNVLEFGAFPNKTPAGYQVIFHRLAQYEPSKYVFADGVKILNMTMESILADEGPQNGYIILFDMTGVKLGHLTRLNLSLLKKFFVFIQEANPVRLKSIHVINTLPILDKIMVVIKPFMKKELYKLLNFYPSNDMQKLYEKIPKDCLPSDFGGTLKTVAEFHVENTERLKRLKDYWLYQETLRVDESQRPKTKKGKKSKQVEVLPDIRTLELD